MKGAAKSGGGSRRSGNRDEGSIAGKSKEVVYLREEEVVVRMVTRSSVRRNKAVYVGDFDSEEDCVDSVSIVSKERKNKDRVVHREEKAVKTEKRVTRRSCKTDVKTATRRKAVVPDEADPEEDEDLAKRDRSRKDVEDCGVVKMNGEQNFVRKAQVGEKRKRDGVEGGCENAQGWTKEQEVSLQRAYFTAKPTPLFWKKVARMVMFISCSIVSRFSEFCISVYLFVRIDIRLW